jgi:hypothetical protein
MSRSNLSPATLDLLRHYDTPTVCNVIELFNIRPPNHGCMDQRIKACFAELPPMVGFAATATFRSASAARGNAYADVTAQVDAFAQVSSPPVVVFQDLDIPSVGRLSDD